MTQQMRFESLSDRRQLLFRGMHDVPMRHHRKTLDTDDGNAVFYGQSVQSMLYP